MIGDVWDYRFRFFGYGNLGSPLWFVGIEEGGDLASNAIHVQAPVPDSDWLYSPELPEEASQLWGRYRNIARAAGAEDNYFMSNMGAIAKPTEQASAGVAGADYTALVRQKRIPALRQLVERYQPRAVVFHGKGAWTRYGVREEFGLSLQLGRIQSYPEQRLVFAPFIGRLGGADRRELEAVLARWVTQDRAA